jgi:hypothetical protein
MSKVRGKREELMFAAGGKLLARMLRMRNGSR